MSAQCLNRELIENTVGLDPFRGLNDQTVDKPSAVNNSYCSLLNEITYNKFGLRPTAQKFF